MKKLFLAYVFAIVSSTAYGALPVVEETNEIVIIEETLQEEGLTCNEDEKEQNEILTSNEEEKDKDQNEILACLEEAVDENGEKPEVLVACPFSQPKEEDANEEVVA